MDFSTPASALLADPSATLKSGLVALHLIGLVLGLGAATVLDLVIIRFLVNNKVTIDYCHVIDLSSKIVTVGLVILWLSGIGFLIHYSVLAPEKLGNQKIWAKVTIVGILTLNGVFIHRTILPLVRDRVGQGLFDGLPRRRQSVMLACGAVSAVSWYVPLVLGAVPQLNFVPAATILFAYAFVLSAAIVTAHWLGRAMLPRMVTIPHAEYEDLMGRLTQQDELLHQCLAFLRAQGLAAPSPWRDNQNLPAAASR